MDERCYQSTICCCNHGANLGSSPNDFVFDSNHSNKNLNDGTCFRVVGSTVYGIDRKYMLKTFGTDYALDFLFNYMLTNLN